MKYFIGKHPEVVISFDFTNYCKLNCSYCVNKTGITSNEHEAKKIDKNKVKEFRKINFNFIIHISGGEPTLYDDIEYFINELTDMKFCKEIVIFTNLVQPVSYWEMFNSNKLKIIAAHHSEYHYGFEDKFIELYNLGYNMELSFLLSNTDDRNFKIFKKIVDTGACYRIVNPRDANDYVNKVKHDNNYHRFFKYKKTNKTNKDINEDVKPILEDIQNTRRLPYMTEKGFTDNRPKSFKGWNCVNWWFYVRNEYSDKPLEYQRGCNDTKIFNIDELIDCVNNYDYMLCNEDECHTYLKKYLKFKKE